MIPLHRCRWILLGILLLVPSPVGAVRLGLWVEAEGSNRVLEARALLEAMLRAAVEMGVQDLFLQVYRGNRAWYASSFADEAPFRTTLAREGYDPLAFVLARAHAKGIRVHAWMNLFNLGRNREAPILRWAGQGAVLTDSRGRSLLQYPDLQPGDGFTLDTPGLWLDPANPEVQTFLARLILELLDRYPTLDGLHFDHIRYPYTVPMIPGSRHRNGGLDFGYGEETIGRFKAETGLDAWRAKEDPAVAEAWDGWRREQLTGFVKKLRILVKQRHPKIILSAALLPWMDRAYLTAFQDWRRWMEEGLLDMGIIMNYTRDGRLARYISRQSVAFRGKGKIAIGLGAYLFDEPQALLQQMEEARREGADGIVLFSYENLLRKNSLFRALRQALP